MLFDLDSPAALRERASIIKTNDLEQGNQGLPTTAVGSSSKFGITADEIGKFESNIESLARYGGPQGIARLLKVEPSKGIDGTPDDIQRRAEAFGTNTYPVKEPTPFWVYVWEAFQDETLLILIICAAASLAVGMTTEDPKEGWYDGGGVCFAILCCVTVASVSDYKQAQQFQRLNDEKRKIYVNVTRAGKREKPSIFELVVGDIVHLSIGDQIPADGLLITGRSLVVDESSMTGESDPLMKDEEEEPFLMSGCKVLDGFGTMLVTAVGMRTEWGRVMATLTEENDEETPLQARLNSLAANIGKVGLTVAVVCFVVCLIRLLCTIDLKQFSTADGREIVDYFAVAVTIVVVAVPEGLPLAVTLSLAYSMKQMMNDRALVRHLAACETMGSATAICSDKTGTLTMNQMAVVTSWVCGKLREPDDLGEPFNHDVLKLLFEAICLNTNGVVQHVEGSDVPEAAGTPTEVAVLNWGVKLGADFDKIKKDTAVLEVDAFNSTKKRMGVITKTADGKAWVHWKGASEVVLSQCNQIIDAEGKVVNLTPEKLEELQGIISSFANAALRTLCLGCKEIPVPEARTKRQSVTLPEDGLVCLAIVGIKDPCRPGVPEAVQKCQSAGIKVRMVTGDNLITAKAIAAECGILTEHGTAIEGKTFRAMTADEQYDILPSVQVMARSSPTDKYTMVKRLLELGEIVAVTGDGTNDAPALHEASIGLAMGIAGTEVAKESSDIIIMDDNFASIVKVVRWGRSVYFNIQKFIQFQLTVNGVALTLNFVSAIFEGHAPLTAVQLLWVNLIMDTMGALALATEPPTDALMAVPPIRKREPLITNIMWRNILAQSAYQLALLLTLQFRGIELLDLRKDVGASPPPPPPSKHSYVPADRAHKELMTIIFDSFVFCQIFNEINARHPMKFNVFKGFFSNKLFLYVIAFTCFVQVMLSEFCGTFTSTVKIGHRHWIMCVGLGAISLPLAVVVKLIPVPQRPLSTYVFFWQKDVSQHLTFRHGRSIKHTMLARTPSGLQKTSSMKFYTAGAGDEASKIIEAVTGSGAPATSRRCWDCWPSTPAPSASTDTGNPAKRHSNVAWS